MLPHKAAVLVCSELCRALPSVQLSRAQSADPAVATRAPCCMLQASRKTSRCVVRCSECRLTKHVAMQVSRRKVIPVVLAQHMLQMVIGLFTLDQPNDDLPRTLGSELVRFVGAVIVLDTWQFCFHKLMHEVDWLYRNVHVWHHKMYIPFSYGALYQHPLEMLIMDTLSGLVAVSATGAHSVAGRRAATPQQHFDCLTRLMQRRGPPALSECASELALCTSAGTLIGISIIMNVHAFSLTRIAMFSTVQRRKHMQAARL